MQITIIDIFFSIVDVTIFTFCAVFMLRFLPMKRQRSLWIKILAWCIFATLSILLPNFGRNDAFTIIVLTFCYLLFGWFLYHKSKMGLLYQLVYMMGMFATQLIGIFLVVKLYQIFGLESKLQYYLLVLFKAFFLIAITLILRGIIKKRYVSDQQYLTIKGMILIPILSVILIFMYVIGGDVFFCKIWI